MISVQQGQLPVHLPVHLSAQSVSCLVGFSIGYSVGCFLEQERCLFVFCVLTLTFNAWKFFLFQCCQIWIKCVASSFTDVLDLDDQSTAPFFATTKTVKPWAKRALLHDCSNLETQLWKCKCYFAHAGTHGLCSNFTLMLSFAHQCPWEMHQSVLWSFNVQSKSTKVINMDNRKSITGHFWALWNFWLNNCKFKQTIQQRKENQPIKRTHENTICFCIDGLKLWSKMIPKKIKAMLKIKLTKRPNALPHIHISRRLIFKGGVQVFKNLWKRLDGSFVQTVFLWPHMWESSSFEKLKKNGVCNLCSDSFLSFFAHQDLGLIAQNKFWQHLNCKLTDVLNTRQFDKQTHGRIKPQMMTLWFKAQLCSHLDDLMQMRHHMPWSCCMWNFHFKASWQKCDLCGLRSTKVQSKWRDRQKQICTMALTSMQHACACFTSPLKIRLFVAKRGNVASKVTPSLLSLEDDVRLQPKGNLTVIERENEFFSNATSTIVSAAGWPPAS